MVDAPARARQFGGGQRRVVRIVIVPAHMPSVPDGLRGAD
jgi:hypothetical protein